MNNNNSNNNLFPPQLVIDPQEGNNNQTSLKIRNTMLGALYQAGDPEKQDGLLKTWGIKENEYPASRSLFNEWVFQAKTISENYVSKEEQENLEVEKCPKDILKIMGNKKTMYFILSSQLGMILPHKDYSPKQFMWACFLGIKKHMTLTGEDNSLQFLKHNPGFTIKENSIHHWVSHLDQFQDWELYVPDPYIKKIKEQAKINDVENRNYIAFDTSFLLSLFRSLNEDAYKVILRQKFQLRQQRLKTRVSLPPLMVQKHFITKLRQLYDGDDITAILPANLKKCRQRNMKSQMPKIAKDRQDLKFFLKKASTIIHENMIPSQFQDNGDGAIEEEKEEIQMDPDFVPDNPQLILEKNPQPMQNLFSQNKVKGKRNQKKKKAKNKSNPTSIANRTRNKMRASKGKTPDMEIEDTQKAISYFKGGITEEDDEELNKYMSPPQSKDKDFFK